MWKVYWPEDAFWVTLSVLVATCPCALALATPTAVTCATGIFTKMGVIARKPGVFEKLTKINHVVFDKTGTLTCGNLEIESITLLASLDEKRALSIVAALEESSLHPIATAFEAYRNHDLQVLDSQNHVGQGVSGTINGVNYRVGSATYVGLPPQKQQAVYLSDSTSVLVKFVLVDAIRSDAAKTVNLLSNSGYKVSIASGDASSHVEEVAKKVGVIDINKGLSPEGKLSLIRTFQQNRSVAMFGDGINDAPVLAGANLSIAMGSGAAVTKSSADIILLGDQLSRFMDAVTVARLTEKIIKQNLFWALGYNLFIIPLAVTGHVLPYVAALGMSASSLIVVGNSLRLLKVRL